VALDLLAGRLVVARLSRAGVVGVPFSIVLTRVLCLDSGKWQAILPAGVRRARKLRMATGVLSACRLRYRPAV